MPTGNQDADIVNDANENLKGLRYTGGFLNFFPSGGNVFEGSDNRLEGVASTSTTPVDLVGNPAAVEWPYGSCLNPIRNTENGELYMDRFAFADATVSSEGDLLPSTDSNGRVLGTTQIRADVQMSNNPDLIVPKKLVFYGSVDIYTRVAAIPAEQPRYQTDPDGTGPINEGDLIPETFAQENVRAGFPGYLVDAAVYVRDGNFKKGYAFRSTEGGYIASDDGSFRTNVVAQNIPVTGYVGNSDTIVIDVHVAPSIWKRNTGGIRSESKYRLTIHTIQVEEA